MKTRQDIIDYARSLLNTPFHHQGRLPKVGLDCIGLIVCIAKELGLPFHDLQGYQRMGDGITLPREMERGSDAIPFKEVQPGDMFTFWVSKPEIVQHVGLATDKGIIHTWYRARKVVEHNLDMYWYNHIAKAYRPRGIDPTPYSKRYPWPLPPIDPRVLEEVKKAQPHEGCCG